MTDIADRFVVVLDANVLFAFRKRDILLSFYSSGLFRARWSEQILDEWESSLVKKRTDLKEGIRSSRNSMRNHFPEAIISGYEALVDALDLPDSNDRHVLAAAIQCGAQLIVTDNLKDFPENKLNSYNIKAISADDFLALTFDLYPAESLTALRKLRIDYKNPPYSPPRFVFDLTAKGLPKLASRLRRRQEFL